MNKDVQINVEVSEYLLKTVGRQINLARICRGLSVKQLSEKSGCGIDVINEIEEGRANSLFIEIVKLLNCMSLTKDIKNIANPDNDEVGIFLAKYYLPEEMDENKYNF